MGEVVAAFDVDGTLTVRDCVVPFLARLTGGRWRLARGLARHPALVGAALVRRDRDALKAAATRVALGGRAVSRVGGEARAFAGLVAAGWMRPDTVARLGWHREQGHHVVLVSASYEAYVAHLGTALGADAVLATRLAVDGEVLTGELDGPNCRGPEKVVRLRQWMADHGAAGAVLWAYGDSDGDDELLAAADHALRVGDDPIPRTPQ